MSKHTYTVQSRFGSQSWHTLLRCDANLNTRADVVRHLERHCFPLDKLFVPAPAYRIIETLTEVEYLARGEEG